MSTQTPPQLFPSGAAAFIGGAGSIIPSTLRSGFAGGTDAVQPLMLPWMACKRLRVLFTWFVQAWRRTMPYACGWKRATHTSACVVNRPTQREIWRGAAKPPGPLPTMHHSSIFFFIQNPYLNNLFMSSHLKCDMIK